MPGRKAKHTTPDGRTWFAELAAAQERVRNAEHERDDLVHQALTNGLGVRGVAKALRVNPSTVSRRYGRAAR